MSKQLVRIGTRPSRDGRSFTYLLDYVEENGSRRRISLRHADKRKAQRQRDQKERELRMGLVGPTSMRLSKFMEDSLERTGKQIRESTREEYRASMTEFISVIGDMDYQCVTHRHGESFLQHCLDTANSPATAAKKLRQLKRFFQLAVQRDQLEDNPLKNIRPPRVPQKKVRVYSADECARMLAATREIRCDSELRWNAVIAVALTTGMRRGELLNAVWDDVDLQHGTIEVSPKLEVDATWEWHIKGTDCRTLPLTEQVTVMLAELRSEQSNGHPYVFISPKRYERIQQLRHQGKWTLTSARTKIVSNFSRGFGQILKRANVKKGQFHDLRRTALSTFLAQGLSKYDLMTLAGHAKFDTTQRFYLAVEDDLVGRARTAATQGFGQVLARTWHAPGSVA